MVKREVLEAIRFFMRCLEEENLQITKVLLFGSQINERAREDSDIDILIISEDFRNKNIFERVPLTKNPEIKTLKKFMIPMDIISLTPEEFESGTSLIAEYAKQGDGIDVARLL